MSTGNVTCRYQRYGASVLHQAVVVTVGAPGQHCRGTKTAQQLAAAGLKCVASALPCHRLRLLWRVAPCCSLTDARVGKAADGCWALQGGTAQKRSGQQACICNDPTALLEQQHCNCMLMCYAAALQAAFWLLCGLARLTQQEPPHTLKGSHVPPDEISVGPAYSSNSSSSHMNGKRCASQLATIAMPCRKSDTRTLLPGTIAQQKQQKQHSACVLCLVLCHAAFHAAHLR